MEWISDASARPSPPVCASGVRFDELRIVKNRCGFRPKRFPVARAYRDPFPFV